MKRITLRTAETIALTLLILLVAAVVLLIGVIRQKSTLESQVSVSSPTPSASPTTIDTTQITKLPAGAVAAVSTSDHLDGSKSAKVALIEYSDLECPFCKRYEGTVQQLQAQYGDQIVRVFRNFPIDTIHPNAPMEALVGECVADIGGDTAYYKYVHAVFAQSQSTGTSISKDAALAIAAQVYPANQTAGVCLSSHILQPKVDADIASGKTAGVRATPTIFIVNQTTGSTKMIIGAESLQMFQQAINASLAGK